MFFPFPPPPFPFLHLHPYVFVGGLGATVLVDCGFIVSESVVDIRLHLLYIIKCDLEGSKGREGKGLEF